MQSDSQIGVDLALVALALLAGVNYRFRRSILYPPFVFCAMWLLDLLIYRMNLIPVYSLHAITLIVILLGALAFSVAGAAAFFVPRPLVTMPIRVAPTPRRERKGIKVVLLVLLLIGVCVQVRALFAAAAAGNGQGFMASARVAVVANMVQQDEGGSHGAGYWLNFITLSSIYLSVLFRIERRDRLFWFSAALSLASCITTTGRAQILLLFSALICVQLIQTRKDSFLSAVRVMRWPVLGFCALFSLLAYTNKNVSESKGVADFIFAGVIGYIIGPLPSLDQVLTHSRDYIGLPNHTFSFFEKLLDQLGVAHIVPPTSLGNLRVPFFSNVYTIYGFFITDFGIWGTLLVMGGIGFFHVLLYRRARTESVMGLFLFALTLYPLVMCIFGDLYTALGIYIVAILFAVFYRLLCSTSLTGSPMRGARAVEQN